MSVDINISALNSKSVMDSEFQSGGERYRDQISFCITIRIWFSKEN